MATAHRTIIVTSNRLHRRRTIDWRPWIDLALGLALIVAICFVAAPWAHYAAGH